MARGRIYRDNAEKQAAYRERKRKRGPVTSWHKSDIWQTPPDLFAALDAEFHFQLDVAALPFNAKCPRYFTPGMDALAQRWTGVCFMNAPYGPGLRKWVKKAHESAQAGATVVCLLPARTDTTWFHDYVLPYAELRFIRGRLRFNGIDSGATFPSLIAIFRPPA